MEWLRVCDIHLALPMPLLHCICIVKSMWGVWQSFLDSYHEFINNVLHVQRITSCFIGQNLHVHMYMRTCIFKNMYGYMILLCIRAEMI